MFTFTPEDRRSWGLWRKGMPMPTTKEAQSERRRHKFWEATRMAQERQRAGRPFEGAALRREDAERYGLPMSRDAQRPLPASWRIEYGAEDGRRNRANPEGCNKARS